MENCHRGTRRALTLGPILVFIVLIPVLLAFLVAFASKPEQVYTGSMVETPDEPGNENLEWRDYEVDRYAWLTDSGLDFQLAGLTTLVAAVIDLRLIDIWGLAAVAVYTIGIGFGLARYRQHRYWSHGRVPSAWENIPFIIGLFSLAVVEVGVVVWYSAI
jgi:hypothetical protein